MSGRQRLALHGRDHLRGGVDPIPGLVTAADLLNYWPPYQDLPLHGGASFVDTSAAAEKFLRVYDSTYVNAMVMKINPAETVDARGANACWLIRVGPKGIALKVHWVATLFASTGGVKGGAVKLMFAGPLAPLSSPPAGVSQIPSAVTFQQALRHTFHIGATPTFTTTKNVFGGFYTNGVGDGSNAEYIVFDGEEGDPLTGFTTPGGVLTGDGGPGYYWLKIQAEDDAAGGSATPYNLMQVEFNKLIVESYVVE